MSLDEARKTILNKIKESAEATTDPGDLLKLAQAWQAVAAYSEAGQ